IAKERKPQACLLLDLRLWPDRPVARAPGPRRQLRRRGGRARFPRPVAKASGALVAADRRHGRRRLRRGRDPRRAARGEGCIPGFVAVRDRVLLGGDAPRPRPGGRPARAHLPGERRLRDPGRQAPHARHPRGALLEELREARPRAGRGALLHGCLASKERRRFVPEVGTSHQDPYRLRLASSLRRERRAGGPLRHAGRGGAPPAARRAAGDRARLRQVPGVGERPARRRDPAAHAEARRAIARGPGRARLRRRRDRRFPESPRGERLLMAERRNLVWPIVLIAVGLLFLAYNLGYLRFSELKDIIGTWWPLILIGLGIAGLLGKR